MKTNNELVPFDASHPGGLILDEIEFRGISQADLALQMDVKKSFLNELIKGKRALTADIALLLEKILEIPAEYWMNLQSQYELDNARIKEKNISRLANAESWNIIKQLIPVGYFKKHEYFQDNIEANIKKVQDIYEVANIDQLVQKTAYQHVALHRKSEKLQIDDKNMLAWNMLARFEAKQQDVNSFNFNNIPSLVSELKQIFFENENTIQKVKSKLKQYGVKFVLIDKIEKAPIDGYTFWSENNPAIAMTIRHKRIDNFAFTIMHELGHIDLHLRANRDHQFFDLSEKKRSVETMEMEADTFAQTNLIQPDQWDTIIKLPELNDYSIKMISNKFSIHPAIILGRINHELNHYAISTVIDKKLN